MAQANGDEAKGKSLERWHECAFFAIPFCYNVDFEQSHFGRLLAGIMFTTSFLVQ